MPHFFYENKWNLLGVGSVIYLSMFLFMGLATEIYDESPFFNVEVNGDDPLKNPQVLGVPITTTGTFLVFCIFFFINAFIRVWLRVLIIDRYSLLINDGDSKIKEGIVKNYPPHLFMMYNLWNSAGFFFNILGVLSNIFFFVATVAGAFIGNILSRMYLIGLDDLENEKEHLMSSTLFKPMLSLNRRR